MVCMAKVLHLLPSLALVHASLLQDVVVAAAATNLDLVLSAQASRRFRRLSL